MEQAIIDFLYEARMLKEIPRSGYRFLGVGRESIADHTYMTTFVANVLAMLQPDADALKLLRMCLLHDLPEARTGDLNAVQKKYVVAEESRAINELARTLSFGDSIAELLAEFRSCETLEAKLAHDADQLSFLIELKSLSDIGYATPAKWIKYVQARVVTEVGRRLLMGILETESDHWWLKDF